MAARKPKGRWASRIVGEADVAPDQLLANPNNFRMHPAQQQNALADVLDKVGWVQRVVVNKRTGHVIDGHLRVEMAISQGEPSVPVVYVDCTQPRSATYKNFIRYFNGDKIPYVVLLGPNGKVVKTWTGYQDIVPWTMEIEKLAGQKF